MSNRRDEVFTVLKTIRRTIDEQRELIERAIKDAAADRALADHFRDAATGGEWGKQFPEPPLLPTPLPVLLARIEMILGGGASLHTLCLRLIDERDRLGRELESIRHELELVGIVPRTRRLGRGGRGTPPNGGE